MRDDEAVYLLTQLDVCQRGLLTARQLAVALLDYHEMRCQLAPAWQAAARFTFASLDRHRSGVIDSRDVAACLLPSSPRHEVGSSLG
jgi:hypothetical protein